MIIKPEAAQNGNQLPCTKGKTLCARARNPDNESQECASNFMDDGDFAAGWSFIIHQQIYVGVAIT